MREFRSGFVAIIGRPNVGKSTLMNHILDFDLAITTPKAQTTRNMIRGVYQNERMQIAFLDTPGIHQPRNLLDRYMMKSASVAIGMADLCLLIIEASWRAELRKTELELLRRLRAENKPCLLLINKIDRSPKSQVLPLIDLYRQAYDFAAIIPMAARTGEGVEIVLNEIYELLPGREPLFTEADWTDQSERVLAREAIREALLFELQEELPYGTAVVIETFKESADGLHIEATIYCEEERHRGMILGAGGQKIKQIGVRSRERLTRLLEQAVELFIEVRAKKAWRDSDLDLVQFGYDAKDLN